MPDPDVIVVGAGICGAAVARCLADRGRDVLVVDRAGIAAGSTGRGEGNVLVCDKPPGPERELALVGRELWVELGTRHPAGRVTRTGALLLARAARPGDADGAEHESALADGVRVTFEPGDLMVDAPGMAGALLAGLPTRFGAGATVESVAADGIRLAGGERLGAGAVVVCAGAWSGALTGLPVEPRQGQLVALAAPRGLIRHKLIEAAYVDAVESTDPGLLVASVIEQTLDGDEVLVGSSRRRVGFDETVDPAVTDAMLQRACGWVPALRELPVSRAWAGLRPWLPDGLPAIGRLPGGVWVSTGHEGGGVGLGPVSGLLLAQLICGEAPVVDPTPFAPGRFAAGMRQLA